MTLFALDTSSKYFSLVIARDDKILAKVFRPYAKELSRTIIAVIDTALQRSGVTLEDIDYFGIGIGPGSFTALRIGVATLKGLLFPFDKPVVTVGSLDVIAYAARQTRLTVCPIVDAKRGLVYCALYTFKNSQPRRISKYLLIPIEELLKKIPDKAVFIGDGIALYGDSIKKKLGTKAYFVSDEALWSPQPENLLACVREKIEKKEFEGINTLVPLYLYPKECQISNKMKRR